MQFLCLCSLHVDNDILVRSQLAVGVGEERLELERLAACFWVKG